jgi:hypothetical protein
MRWLRFAAAACVAAAPLGAPAAELFPYNPPPASGLQVRPQEQRAAPANELSADELRAIDALATKTNRLPAAQKREVRAAVLKSRDDALARRDWHQAAYYTELLNRIPESR